jgi:hypothetical protein
MANYLTDMILKSIQFFFSFLSLCILNGCVGNMNPTGGNSTPNYPFFITKKPSIVKKIAVPTGTKLTYEEHFFKEGEQEKMMSEEKLTYIELPMDKVIYWGGVSVSKISKFFNSEMRGFTVYADFKHINTNKRTPFSELWKSCSNGLGISVRSTDDWSFNKKNISDVQSCSVLYQRYFKEDKEQQDFLNSLYTELNRVE